MENKKNNFFVNIINYFENFKVETFKKQQAKKKELKEEEKQKAKELEESSTTRADIGAGRESYVKRMMIKVGLAAVIIVLISSAFIMAFQDNEKVVRKRVNIQKSIKKATSFGKIDEKDYFMQQNVFSDRLEGVEKKIDKTMEQLNKNISKQIIASFATFMNTQDKKQEKLKKDILKVVKNGNKSLEEKITQNQLDIQNLVKEQEKLKNRKTYQGVNGKIIIPNFGNTQNSNQQTVLKKDKKTTTISKYNNPNYKEEIIKKVVQVEEEIMITDNDIVSIDFETSTLKKEIKEKFQEFKLDLMTSMARVTLLNGVAAPTGTIGTANPVPVLMQIEDDMVVANNETIDLKGCFLRGAAFGDITSSRVEIFGTALSCIINTQDGKKYKIEETFPDNQVWIQGEDGKNGVLGVIVDSSGKVLSKSIAIGFLQGMSQYFQSTAASANTVTNTEGTVAAVETSMKAGLSQGLGSSFDLVIQQYQKILKGYYPYIDLKGGRKHLTAIFAGGTTLTIKEYNEPNFQELINTKMKRGYGN